MELSQKSTRKPWSRFDCEEKGVFVVLEKSLFLVVYLVLTVLTPVRFDRTSHFYFYHEIIMDHLMLVCNTPMIYGHKSGNASEMFDQDHIW